MQHRRFWARFTLLLFVAGLAVSAYGLFAQNPAITRSSLAFIVLAAFATYLLKKDFQRELDELDEARRLEQEGKESTEDASSEERDN